MDDSLRLKLILVGLFLAALALGYFIFSQRLKSGQTLNSEQRSLPPITMVSPSPISLPAAEPVALGEAIPGETKGGQALPNTGISSLPATGTQEVLISVLSASAVLIGWSLRKFPH